MEEVFNPDLLPSPSLGISLSLVHGPTPLPISHHQAQGKLIPDLDATDHINSRLAKLEHRTALPSVIDVF